MKKVFTLLVLLFVINIQNAQNCSSWFTVTNQGNGYIYFNGNANYPQNTSTRYDWNFGDGRYDYTWNMGGTIMSGTAANGYCPPAVTHHYLYNGTYIVQFTVTSADQATQATVCSYTAVDTVVISGLSCPIDGIMSFNQSQGLTYNFNAHDANLLLIEKAEWLIVETNDLITLNGPANSLNANYTFPSPGIYNICLYLTDSSAAGVCYDTTCTTLNVPATPPVPACSASFMMYQDTLNMGTWYAYDNSYGSNLSYVWDFGDGTSDTNAFTSHTYAVPGQYDICLTVTSISDSCTSTFCDTSSVHRMNSNSMMSQFIVVNPMGIESKFNNEMNIRLYPNPAKESVTIQTALRETGMLEVYNPLGQTLIRQEITGDSVVIDLSELEPGIYLISLSTSIKTETVKLIRE
jgi:PKD repeat protein